jgi:hypothetical protein
MKSAISIVLVIVIVFANGCASSRTRGKPGPFADFIKRSLESISERMNEPYNHPPR